MRALQTQTPRAPVQLGRVCECLTGRGEGIGAQQPWAYGPRIRNNGSCGARLLQRERHSARPARLPSGTSTVEHAHQCLLALPTSVSAAGAAKPWHSWPAALLPAAKQRPHHPCLRPASMSRCWLPPCLFSSPPSVLAIFTFVSPHRGRLVAASPSDTDLLSVAVALAAAARYQPSPLSTH
jgi:hypothetical protein